MMKKTRMTSLRMTIAELNRADSLMPMTRTQVTRAVMTTAGRLQTIGVPKMWGAESKNPSVREAVTRSVRSQAGIWMPNPLRSSTKYPDHDTATATLPIAYSMMRSQPMIQAMNSPSVAYEYV